jgi:DNA modification methylase
LELIDVDFDIESLGFELPEPEIEVEPDDAPTIEEVEHRTKLGQLWKLGDHLLYCGDSTEEATFTRLMGDDKAHLIWTDPPWNVNYGAVDEGNQQGYKVRTIMNDHMNEGQWDEFVGQFCKTLKDYSEPGAPIYLVMSAQEWPVIDRNLREVGFHWSSTVIWAKDRLVLSRKDYHTQYEPIWYGWNADAARLAVVEDRKQSDLWEIERPSRSELHPTMKPIELVQKSIVNSSKPGNIVLDSFGGSGSTLIACEQTNRKCRMVELDPQYCDVIIARWEKFTGKTAELLPGT